jgi:hypothetical protein
MSYRLEKKFIIDTRMYQNFTNYLKAINANKIYEKRRIFSTYFDNDFFSSYNESEEGTIPRKKIRIRSYDTDIHSNNAKLEIKISSENNRFKKTENIKDAILLQRFLSKGLTDKSYGHCKAVLDVSYDREYYQINEQRITVDKNICYWQHKKDKKKFYEPLSIVEFKSDIDSDLNQLNSIISSSISRFSKYCRGMNKVFFNIKNYG